MIILQQKASYVGDTLLEYYSPIIKYIKGRDNDAADALIKLLLINSDATERKLKRIIS